MAEKIGGVFCIIPPHVREELSDSILLVRHSYGEGLWSLPGGAIERGETAPMVAVRETKEETGISITDIADIGVFRAGEWVFLFGALSYVGALTVTPTAEIAERRFVTRNELFVLRKKNLIYPAQWKMAGYYLNHWLKSPGVVIHDILSPGFPVTRKPWPEDFAEEPQSPQVSLAL